METTANAPVLDIVIPVHNEQHTLERCVRTLHGFLSADVPCTFRITIADNASTDTALTVAAGLADAQCGHTLRDGTVPVAELRARLGRGALTPSPVLSPVGA
jgi:hypothetical protein